MTEELKDKVLKYIIDHSDSNGSISLTSKQLNQEIDISISDLSFLLKDLNDRNIISYLKTGQSQDGLLCMFYTNHVTKQFLQNGGFGHLTLENKKAKQLQIDLNEAALKSANASEQSAIEAKKSRQYAFIAIFISLIPSIWELIKYLFPKLN